MPADKRTLNRLRKLVKRYPDELAKLLLEGHFWLSALQPNIIYRRRSDDTDGLDSTLGVSFSQDSDGWIDIISDIDPESGDRHFTHRFRVPLIGGGRSPRVRNALLVLALAIKLDNEELPDPRRRIH
ncbi:hypothetical protein EPN83_00835 [Patescibacteria group bacterium]|nr:MAG: hypothetical protein EPN83_00835 [Patescibacteria group bacterium]